jgi:hypothetical protein
MTCQGTSAVVQPVFCGVLKKVLVKGFVSPYEGETKASKK